MACCNLAHNRDPIQSVREGTVRNTKVTSHGQTGGITAGAVSIIGRSNQPPSPKGSKKKWWWTWGTWIVGTVAFLASLIAVLDYFEIQPWEKAVSSDKISVTSYNQSGGITAGTVNVGPQPRHFGPADAETLSKAIPVGSKVTDTAMGPDNEALAYAFEIYNWLRANGYTEVKGPNEAWGRLPPVYGQSIQKTANGYDIVIGANRR